jgi:hypothetical protein
MKNAFLRACFKLGQLCSGRSASRDAPRAVQVPAPPGRAVIIATCINKFCLRGNRHEVEDGVRDCLNEIASHEGWSNKAPNWEYLYKWEARPDILSWGPPASSH